ncbi:MAG: NAD-dependent deacylase [Pyrinomonadaceae bacterium]|nr:NAD-dependent deacylase [Pyrinomonadaceae bacterium]MCX7638830.1 NAD-dependent deacylase [Pyrinomonadaceae bacterium]MDW8305034.1 NAD-dependent deacylase [Acidobacteriota bacterium]
MKDSPHLEKIFQDARSICVLTGAGISAESGVPTFRGGGGSVVWKGMPFDEISSARMVRENLDEVWEWFDYRRNILKDCSPNLAHYILAEWENKFFDFTLITQNVDGLHTKAGSRKVLELHGNINRSRCLQCEKRFQMNETDIPHKPEICDECGSRVRPDVVLFGEFLPISVYQEAERKSSQCDLFLIIGTSALVYPAAGLAEVAKINGAFLIEINPEETPMTSLCHKSFRMKASQALEFLRRFVR